MGALTIVDALSCSAISGDRYRDIAPYMSREICRIFGAHPLATGTKFPKESSRAGVFNKTKRNFSNMVRQLSIRYFSASPLSLSLSLSPWENSTPPMRTSVYFFMRRSARGWSSTRNSHPFAFRAGFALSFAKPKALYQRGRGTRERKSGRSVTPAEESNARMVSSFPPALASRRPGSFSARAPFLRAFSATGKAKSRNEKSNIIVLVRVAVTIVESGYGFE